jgi:Transposase domain (DUF772)
LNRVQSSRRLERETQRNIEVMWLTGRLMPDFKTIADFRRDNGPAIRAVCGQFVALCRRLNLFTQPDRTAVVRTRMPGGVGGAMPRGVPLSRSLPLMRHSRPRA